MHLCPRCYVGLDPIPKNFTVDSEYLRCSNCRCIFNVREFEKHEVEKVKNIIVNLQFEATHNWPECPYEEVKYLQYEHRHVFHICCKKRVEHNDRDVEIIMLKKDIECYLIHKYCEVSRVFGVHSIGKLGRTSCEDLAEELMTEFELNYCSVLEDGENGAEICLRS